MTHDCLLRLLMTDMFGETDDVVDKLVITGHGVAIY